MAEGVMVALRLPFLGPLLLRRDPASLAVEGEWNMLKRAEQFQPGASESHPPHLFHHENQHFLRQELEPVASLSPVSLWSPWDLVVTSHMDSNGWTNMHGPAWWQKQNNKILETPWVSSPECILGSSICVFLWHLASHLKADEHNE